MAYDWSIKEKVSKQWNNQLTLRQNCEALGWEWNRHNQSKLALYAKRFELKYQRVVKRIRRPNYVNMGLDRDVVQELCEALRGKFIEPAKTFMWHKVRDF